MKFISEIDKRHFRAISPTQAIPLSIINGTTSVLGTLCNILLIVLIILNKKLHGVSDILNLSLSISDLLACGVYQPMLIQRINSAEKLSKLHNQFRRALGQGTTVTSCLSLLALTVDRLLYLQYPLKYQRIMTKARAIKVIGAVYIISSISAWYGFQDRKNSLVYKIAFVAPSLLVMIIIHFRILVIVQRQRRRIETLNTSLRFNYNISSRNLKLAGKITKTVLLYVVLYITTWLPITVFQIWNRIHGNTTIWQKYFYIPQTVLQLNSFLNPYLYFLRNGKARKILLDFFQLSYKKVVGIGST